MMNTDTKYDLLLRAVLFVAAVAAIVGGSFLMAEHIRPGFQPEGGRPAQLAAAATDGRQSAVKPEGPGLSIDLQSMRFIIAKFVGWFAIIALIAFFMRRGNWMRREKLAAYGISLFIFGVFFGAEPSPMHPVKDFIFRLGAMGMPVVLFLIFFLVLLIVSILLNRSICAWGCQFGVLQDFVHRLFRNRKDTRHVVTGYKPPFWLGNTVRILTFGAIIIAAFAFSYDLIGAVDPFRIFNPKAIGIGTGIFIGVVSLSSIFVYRPFCHFFCPFGLISRLASRIAIIKIRIDRERCTECEVCLAACHSTAMKWIYVEKKLPPDCYICGSCIASCPTKAISLSGPKGKCSDPNPVETRATDRWACRASEGTVSPRLYLPVKNPPARGAQVIMPIP